MPIATQAKQDKPAPRWVRLHPAYVPAMRLVVAVLMTLIVVQFLAWVIPATPGSQGISHYLPLHGLMETVSILVALMVFAVGWNSRTDQVSGHTVLLACAFFAVACLDFSHTFSYTGMPEFFTPNDPEKHLSFWLSARLLAAFSLLAVLLRPWALKEPGAKYLLFAGTLGLIVVIHWIVLAHQHVLPRLFIPGEGLTPLKKGLEYLCIALNLVTAALLWRRMQKLQPYDAPLLFAAVVVMAMSEFYFTLYTTMTGAYNVLGHVYKVISYLFIYRAVVVNAIERPYRELEAAQSNLELAVRASNTGLWDWDFHSGTVSFSPSWMAQLGYGPWELPHTFDTWVGLLHPDDREAALNHANDCVSRADVMQYESEFRMRHKNGQYHWILARGEKQPDASGRAHRLLGSHVDMTEQKRAEERFRGAVEASSTGMLMVDSQGRIVLANKRAANLFGYGEGELLGQPLERLIPASVRTGHALLISRYMLESSERRMGEGREVFAQHRDGHDFRVEIGLTPIEGQGGRYVLASVEDITVRLQAEQRINQLIYFDSLTNLPNRNLLNDRITRAIAAAERDRHPMAVLFLDLDHFKHVNDTLGHRVGDQLLQAVSLRLAESVRECDTVSRVGGDEFVIVLPDSSVEAAARVATKLQHVLAQPYGVGEQTLIATSSIGIAMYPEDGLDFETLYQRADTAMYRAKQDGRNDHRFFTQEMQARSERILLLENALHQALQRNEFVLHYQP
ncbi:MAG: MASE3 domain-containing protein, partial [Hydrogenophaga sp.]|nr:MASE3 domain-containing protein [Hydrogenophaga sp.]